MSDHARDVRNLLSNPRELCEKLGLAQGSKIAGRGLLIRCFQPDHQERNASCSVQVGGDGTIYYKCQGPCGASGDALSMIATIYDLDRRSDFKEILAIGAELGGDLALAEEIREGHPNPNKPRRAIPTPPAQAPREYPPLHEVEELSKNSNPPDGDAVKYLLSRSIDADLAYEAVFVRSIGQAVQLPPWAKCSKGDWYRAGFRLILPVYDADGHHRSFRAWQVCGHDGPKRLPPSGYKAAGLVLANEAAVSMLAGLEKKPTSLVIVEGEPDLLTWATRVQDDVAVIGVGSGLWTKEHAAKVPAGIPVYIRTHLDDAGQKYATEVAKTLSSKCPIWRLVRADGGDENDCARAGTLPESPAEGCKLVHEQVEDKSAGAGLKPSVSVGSRLSILADTSIKALAQLDVFQRSRQLVDVTRDGKSTDGVIRPGGAPQIRTMPSAKLRELVEDSINFTKATQYGVRSVRPPTEVIETIVARGEWHFIRLLRGIVNWPVLRPNGTILSKPGYDADLALICEPDLIVDVPKNPSRDDAVKAVAMFEDLMSEFPFVGPEHFSSWLAMLLTVFARYAFEGSIPMGIIEAAQKRTGKTLAADLIGYITSGRPLARRPVPGDPEEWRKAMLGIAIAADYAVFFDNVTGVLRSAVLDMVITGGVFKDRLLGKNEDLSIPISTMFLVTSNNATLSSDLICRSLLSRMEALCERPELRTFKRDPIRYCVDNRAKFIGAALTILRAYVVAGRPAVKLRPMNGFDAWSDAVRAPMVWAGLADPGLTQEILRQHANGEDESIGDLLHAWEDALGDRWFTSKDIIDRLGNDGLSTAERALKQALISFCETKDGKLPSPRSLGNHLNGVRGQVKDDLRIESRDKTNAGVPWRVRSLANGQRTGDSDDSGDSVPRSSQQINLPNRTVTSVTGVIGVTKCNGPVREPGAFDDMLEES